MGETPNRCSCGAADAPTALFAIEAVSPPARARLMRCAACGSLYPDRLAAEGAYRDYYTGTAPRAGWRRWVRAIGDRTRRDYLDRATPTGARRILDFGCGGGGYLARIAHASRACFGSDAIKPARSDAAWIWLEPEAVADAAPFDWITLGHVLEHLDDPRATIARLAATLSPQGGLWIATPNADSFLFRRAGAAARDVDYPRHREIFSRAGLARLLAQAGLAVEFRSAPRVNAVLNTLTTVTNIARNAGTPRRWRVATATRTLWALALHLLAIRSRRDRESPELVAVCHAAGKPRAPSFGHRAASTRTWFARGPLDPRLEIGQGESNPRFVGRPTCRNQPSRTDVARS